MPIYEFICETCGKQFEELIPANADNPPCPACGGPGHRKISLPGPLKKGAFPFKPGPVHPLAGKMARSAPSCGAPCGSSCQAAKE